jgi:hypothetical protein
LRWAAGKVTELELVASAQTQVRVALPGTEALEVRLAAGESWSL